MSLTQLNDCSIQHPITLSAPHRFLCDCFARLPAEDCSRPVHLALQRTGLARDYVVSYPLLSEIDGRKRAWIGLVKIKSRRGFVLLPFQTLLALFAILATASALSLAGEALGLDFMKPDNSRAQDRFGDVAGNTRLYIFWLAIVWFAGPAEELYFRGFMIGKLREALGNSTWASALSVLISALIFGLGHVYYLGLRGLVTTGGIAVTLGVLYILHMRNIWPLMIAHAAANTLTFTVVYLQLQA
ncbi:CPBP family intramembrane glutamic endopeptidase [Erythrobacter sp. THAF29]|uniref:CPBP family intramembrane glutamic endopeptidase n=1 Tax=Erythrobacter sp. THAF29 TaxID=2587851 RepID=UPI001269169E|nr:CPBP family intramembrane glutamic endopeptidase [Erythrobacter sp. THAF29]